MQNKAGRFQGMQKLTKNGQNTLKIKTMELLDEHIWGKTRNLTMFFIHDTKSTSSKGKKHSTVFVLIPEQATISALWSLCLLSSD